MLHRWPSQLRMTLTMPASLPGLLLHGMANAYLWLLCESYICMLRTCGICECFHPFGTQQSLLHRLQKSLSCHLHAWRRTLPSNLALCVNPDFAYVRAKDPATDKVYVVAESRLAFIPGAVPKAKKGAKGGDKKDAEPKGWQVSSQSIWLLAQTACNGTLIATSSLSLWCECSLSALGCVLVCVATYCIFKMPHCRVACKSSARIHSTDAGRQSQTTLQLVVRRY